MITVIEIAAANGLKPYDLRKACRAQDFSWHTKWKRWTFPIGSAKEKAIRKIAAALARSHSNA